MATGCQGGAGVLRWGFNISAPATSDALMVVDGRRANNSTSCVTDGRTRPGGRALRGLLRHRQAPIRWPQSRHAASPVDPGSGRRSSRGPSLLGCGKTATTLRIGFELADELGGALRDYRVPAYIVEGNDERLLREVFDRVEQCRQTDNPRLKSSMPSLQTRRSPEVQARLCGSCSGSDSAIFRRTASFKASWRCEEGMFSVTSTTNSRTTKIPRIGMSRLSARSISVQAFSSVGRGSASTPDAGGASHCRC